MTLFSTLSHRLCLAIGLGIAASALYFPATAAELEGTPVQVDSSAPQFQMEAPVPPPPPDLAPPEIAPPPPESDEHQQQWHEQEARIHEAEARVQEAERRARDHQQNWQRELEKNLNQAFGGENKEHNDDDEEITGMIALISIFGMFTGIMILCSPLILVGFYLTLRYKARVRRQQELNINIDKLLAAGRDIPVEILRGDEPKSADETGNLGKGIRNICLGTGLLIFLTVLVGFDIGAVGFILIAIGTSQTLIWYLNKPKTGSVTEQQVGQQD